MKKIYIYLMAVVMFAACADSEDMGVTHPDEYYQPISFDIASQTNVTRASNYIAYEYSRDPHTMGVFAHHDEYEQDNIIFDNISVQASENDGKTSWDYSPHKYWYEYVEAKNFDFFAYMPHNHSATFNKSGDDYTISFPVELSDLFTYDEILFCNKPDQPARETKVKLQMDQSLVGYKVQFKLGEKMDAIRDFKIKSVKIYDTEMISGGTVSRTYSFGSDWTAGQIMWSALTKVALTEGNAWTVPNEDGELQIQKGAADFQQWGKPFYIIPNENFYPMIEVKYDVIVEGTEVVSRKDVVSKIRLNADNFKGYVPPMEMATVNNININIVPSYLYVLADEDQLQGYLVIQ